MTVHITMRLDMNSIMQKLHFALSIHPLYSDQASAVP
jgi:hypothetical protein